MLCVIIPSDFFLFQTISPLCQPVSCWKTATAIFWLCIITFSKSILAPGPRCSSPCNSVHFPKVFKICFARYIQESKSHMWFTFLILRLLFSDSTLCFTIIQDFSITEKLNENTWPQISILLVPHFFMCFPHYLFYFIVASSPFPTCLSQKLDFSVLVLHTDTPSVSLSLSLFIFIYLLVRWERMHSKNHQTFEHIFTENNKRSISIHGNKSK